MGRLCVARGADSIRRPHPMDASASHPTEQTLRAYAMGQLGGVWAGSVRSHLEGCPDCRGRVAGLAPDRLRIVTTMPEPSRPAAPSAEGLSLPEAAPVVTTPPPAASLPPGL